MVPLASVVFAATLSALLGLAFCFLGYRIFLVLLPVWGFFAGFWLGVQTIALILGTVAGALAGCGAAWLLFRICMGAALAIVLVAALPAISLGWEGQRNQSSWGS